MFNTYDHPAVHFRASKIHSNAIHRLLAYFLENYLYQNNENTVFFFTKKSKTNSKSISFKPFPCSGDRPDWKKNRFSFMSAAHWDMCWESGEELSSLCCQKYPLGVTFPLDGSSTYRQINVLLLQSLAQRRFKDVVCLCLTITSKSLRAWRLMVSFRLY